MPPMINKATCKSKASNVPEANFAPARSWEEVNPKYPRKQMIAATRAAVEL